MKPPVSILLYHCHTQTLPSFFLNLTWGVKVKAHNSKSYHAFDSGNIIEIIKGYRYRSPSFAEYIDSPLAQDM